MLFTLNHHLAPRLRRLAYASLGLLLLFATPWGLAHTPPKVVTPKVVTPKVVVIASKDTRIYHQVVDSLKAELKTERQGNDIDISFVFGAEQLTQSTFNYSDLIITVGAQAAHDLNLQQNDSLHNHNHTKVLNTFIPKAAFEALVHSHAQAIKNGQHSAIFLEQPYDRQLQFLQLLAPHARSVGTLLGDSSKGLQPELSAAAKSQQLKLNLDWLTVQDNPVRKLEPIMASSDAFWVIPDQSVFNRNTAKWTLMMSYRQNIPLFAYSKRYVEAGALAAIYSTPETIGEETAQWLKDWLKNPTAPLPQARYPQRYETAINRATARSLGLTLPDNQQLQEVLRQ